MLGEVSVQDIAYFWEADMTAAFSEKYHIMIHAEVGCFNQDDYVKRILRERVPQVILIKIPLS